MEYIMEAEDRCRSNEIFPACRDKQRSPQARGAEAERFSAPYFHRSSRRGDAADAGSATDRFETLYDASEWIHREEKTRAQICVALLGIQINFLPFDGHLSGNRAPIKSSTLANREQEINL